MVDVVHRWCQVDLTGVVVVAFVLVVVVVTYVVVERPSFVVAAVDVIE